MGSGEHLGDPCICCGVPHDEVAVGDCPRAHKCNQTKDALRAEIIAWIKAGNAGTKLINEQGAALAQLRAALQAVYDEFTYDADARRYITRNTLDQVKKALGET